MERDPAEALHRLRSMPVSDLFGFVFAERDDARAVVSMDPAPAMLQVEHVVHGGAVGALADTAAVYLLLPALDPGRAMTSIEFKLNFLRPVLDTQGTVFAEASIVKRGRTVAVARVDVRQAEALCATGLFTYLFMDVG